MPNITINIDVDNEQLLRVIDALVGTSDQTMTIAAPAVRVPLPIALVPTTPTEDDEKPTTNPPAFDTDGIPWDERIHSPSKATTEAGKWRKRRGVADDLFAAVYAELKACAAPAPPVPAPVTVPNPPVPSPSPNVSSVATVAAASATIPSVPAPPVTVDAPAPPAEITYGVFIGLLTQARTVYKLEAATIEAALTSAGLEGPRGLATHPDQVPGAYFILEGLIAEAKK